jgi:hypothetical protein
MRNSKKLSTVKAEVASLLGRLPGPSAREWLSKEIEKAKRDPKRDIETLKMLCAALDGQSAKRSNSKRRVKNVVR